ncbi:MAG TPA: PAS domain S-box protein [Spirochaetota bacterium]|nr:PAS domain S-box protein [Spirochaetota bacterium]
MKIRTRFTLLFLTVAVIPLALSMAVSVWHGARQVHRMTVDQVQSQLRAGAVSLSGFFSSRIAEISTYSHSDILKSMNWRYIGPYLHKELTRHGGIYEKFILGNHNGSYYNTLHGGNPYFGGLRTFDDTSPHAKMKSIHQRDYWKYTVGENSNGISKIYLSNPMISYTANVRQVVIAAPVIAGNRKVLGMIGGAVDWNKIEELINSVRDRMLVQYGKSAKLCIVSGNGTYIYHWDRNKVIHVKKTVSGEPVINSIGEKETISYKITGEKDHVLASAGRMMIRGKAGYVTVQEPGTGNELFFIYAPVKSAGYSMGLYVPKNLVMAPVRDLLGILGFVLLIAVVFAGFVSVIISRRVTNPILLLSSAAQNFAAGRRHEKISAKAIGEIGDLTRTFNNMAQALESREAQLRESEEKFRTLVESMNDGLVVCGPDMVIAYANSGFCMILGYSSEEISGKAIELFLDDSDKAGFREIRRGLQEGKRVDREMIWIRKNGEQVITSVSPSPIYNESHEMQGSFSIVTDITEKKRAEEEKERIQNQLVQIQKMEAIGTLAGGLAHDFNNVLGGIIGSLNLLDIILKDETLQKHEKIRSCLDTAMESSSRAADMIRQLLTLSRKDEIDREPVDIRDPLERVYKICRNSLPESVTLEFELGESPLVIQGDLIRIEQVFINLCVNAAHAMTIMKENSDKEGGICRLSLAEVRTDRFFSRLHTGADEGDSYVRVTVSDSGVGMSEATRNKIFEPFFTTKSKDSGTGLGLSVAYNIVKQHGGFIDVISEKDKGTTFHVYFPKLVSADAVINPEQDEAVMFPGEGKILIIDDDVTLLGIARDMMGQCGYDVIVTDSSQEGITKFRELHKDLAIVVLDMSLPVQSGLEVYEVMRSVNPDVPVLIASGFAQDERVLQAIELGAAGYLYKPYTVYQLSKIVREIIDQHRL